jgi:DNA-binding response OmpR family regulator
MSPTDQGYILIIEDDPGVREGLAAVIENEGYPASATTTRGPRSTAFPAASCRA